MFNENETKSKGKISKWFLLLGGAVILIGIIAGLVYLKGEKKIALPELRPSLPSIGQEVVVGNAKWKVIEVKDRGNILSGSENSFCKSIIELIKDDYCQCRNFKVKDFVQRSIKELKTACKGKHGSTVGECIESIKDVRERECKDRVTGGKFIKIIMAVENLGDIKAGVGRVVLVDIKGNEFGISGDLQKWIPHDQYFGECNPMLTSGESYEISAIYEIPKNIKNLKAKVSELVPEPKCDSYILSWEFKGKPPSEYKTALISLGI